MIGKIKLYAHGKDVSQWSDKLGYLLHFVFKDDTINDKQLVGCLPMFSFGMSVTLQRRCLRVEHETKYVQE